MSEFSSPEVDVLCFEVRPGMVLAPVTDPDKRIVVDEINRTFLPRYTKAVTLTYPGGGVKTFWYPAMVIEVPDMKLERETMNEDMQRPIHGLKDEPGDDTYPSSWCGAAISAAGGHIEDSNVTWKAKDVTCEACIRAMEVNLTVPAGSGWIADLFDAMENASTVPTRPTPMMIDPDQFVSYIREMGIPIQPLQQEGPEYVWGVRHHREDYDRVCMSEDQARDIVASIPDTTLLRRPAGPWEEIDASVYFKCLDVFEISNRGPALSGIIQGLVHPGFFLVRGDRRVKIRGVENYAVPGAIEATGRRTIGLLVEGAVEDYATGTYWDIEHPDDVKSL